MYLQKTSQLGELKLVGVPELKATSTSTTVAEGAATFATYLVPAEFDTGRAGIQLGLVHRNDEVRINSVKYLSDVFFQDSL